MVIYRLIDWLMIRTLLCGGFFSSHHGIVNFWRCLVFFFVYNSWEGTVSGAFFRHKGRNLGNFVSRKKENCRNGADEGSDTVETCSFQSCVDRVACLCLWMFWRAVFLPTTTVEWLKNYFFYQLISVWMQLCGVFIPNHGTVNFFMRVVSLYEGQSVIINTRLAFWRLGQIKHSTHSKMKREGLTGRESRSAVSKHGDERFRTGLWSTAGANWAHLIKQSITASSRKAIVLPKRFRIRSYQWQIFFIKLPEIEDRISLNSGYHELILKDTLYREQAGRVWKWVILICVGSEPFRARA